MNNFKDIFAKWELENQDFDYAKTLVDKNEDEDFCKEQLSSQKIEEVSIDLHGFTRYEAIAKVDSLLNKYRNASDIKIRIIHGAGTHSKGEPVLKKVINQCLKNHPLVRYFRPGRINEGGVGVTIVFIKT